MGDSAVSGSVLDGSVLSGSVVLGCPAVLGCSVAFGRSALSGSIFSETVARVFALLRRLPYLARNAFGPVLPVEPAGGGSKHSARVALVTTCGRW